MKLFKGNVYVDVRQFVQPGEAPLELKPTTKGTDFHDPLVSANTGFALLLDRKGRYVLCW